MTAATLPAPTAVARGIALHEAAVRLLGPLLDDMLTWQRQANADLGAVLCADDETRAQSSALVSIAVETHADLMGLVGRSRRRLASLRGMYAD